MQRFFRACEEPFCVKFSRWLKYGYAFDKANWIRQMRTSITRGDTTFLEAYRLTGRIINITVTGTSKYSPSVILNYRTSPDVVIWSAVLASSAFPNFLAPIELQLKNPVTNELEPFHVHGKTCQCGDGQGSEVGGWDRAESHARARGLFGTFKQACVRAHLHLLTRGLTRLFLALCCYWFGLSLLDVLALRAFFLFVVVQSSTAPSSTTFPSRRCPNSGDATISSSAKSTRSVESGREGRAPARAGIAPNGNDWGCGKLELSSAHLLLAPW